MRNVSHASRTVQALLLADVPLKNKSNRDFARNYLLAREARTLFRGSHPILRTIEKQARIFLGKEALPPPANPTQASLVPIDATPTKQLALQVLNSDAPSAPPQIPVTLSSNYPPIPVDLLDNLPPLPDDPFENLFPL